MSCVTIFTDGASKGNPGPGGWAAIVADEKTVRELGGREERTTNNRMELQAVLEALAAAQRLSPSAIDIYADSSYVVLGATKWGSGWRKKGWLTSQKEPVLNRDIWEPLLESLDTITTRIEWHTVGGHVNIPGNERVDEIASSLALGESVELYEGSRAGYSVDLDNIAHDADMHKKKSDSRTRSKQKAFSYVSEVGGVVQVHRTWAECEARVRGKRARFKKALTADDEAAIVRAFSK